MNVVIKTIIWSPSFNPELKAGPPETTSLTWANGMWYLDVEDVVSSSSPASMLLSLR